VREPWSADGYTGEPGDAFYDRGGSGDWSTIPGEPAWVTGVPPAPRTARRPRRLLRAVRRVVAAGMVLAPSADNPLDHPARARAREAHVLDRLVATHVLSGAQAAAALSQPVSRLVGQAGSGCG
jgi:hypothetical protein